MTPDPRSSAGQLAKAFVIVAIVEAGDEAVLCSAVADENRAVLHRHFLQRLETIGRERRTDHIDRVRAVARECRQRFARIRLQPARASEA